MFKRVLPIIKKEFIHLIRDPRTLLLMFFLPVFMLVLFGYAVSFDVKHIPLAVLDQDLSAESRRYISRFIQSGYFDLIENLGKESQFAESLDSGRVKVIFNLPPDFSQKILSGTKAELQILVDGSDPTWTSAALSYINSINAQYYQGLMTKVFIRKSPVDLIPRIWYNENLRSLNFFIPGLICIILMMMSATLTSLTIISEKEQGTMESLVVSPVRKNELMLGKILPYVIIAFTDILLVTAIGVFWFQVPLKGSLLLLMLNSFIFLMAAMGIGIFVSSHACSSQEAVQIALLATMLPSLLLSGFVFPIENMPWILQGISFLIPARYFLSILRGIFLKGIGFNFLWLDMFFMTILSLGVMGLSIRKFKKRI